ncbi:S8 family serine peptidase [Clostridium gasigenes]|uniref:S8 family serine peptidase n=1 Tax=Clostridium gasigenes TaxID=94869 RepID=UPI001C0CE3EB|nr:S8 family serine peptidase [Clostridium gasigenes]MBU3108890.1 S8 family serine peptidase [Clostridium gasigenes]
MIKVKKSICLITTYIFIISMIVSNISYDVLASTSNNDDKSLEVISGQVVVKLKNLEDTTYKTILDKYKGVEKDIYENYILVSLENEKIESFREEIKGNANVEYTEMNAIGEKSSVPLDALATSQDYLFNTSSIESWDLVTDQMKKEVIKIAIVDSGIKSNHEDLDGKVEISLGYNFVSNNDNATDDNGHGTNIAGVIAGKHNKIGINGIAGQLNTRLIPVKVLDSKGIGTTLNISKGIKYAADKGANIINISINGKGYSKVIDDAIKYAIAKGALVVASSGNKGEYVDNYWPCNSEGVLVVGDKQGNSNKGTRVDIAVNSEGISSGINAEGYEDVKGSSISAAIVTAAAALVKSKNIGYSADEIKNVLKNSVIAGGNSEDDFRLSIKSSFSSESRFIEIISPTVAKEIDGDVEVNALALKSGDVSNVKFYLNGDTNPYGSVNGNGSKNYKETFKYEDLLNGVNKVVVIATDKSGKTFEEEKYFKSSSKSTTLTISVKGRDGNPLKNALVKTSSSAEVLTNEIGEAKFLDINTSVNDVLITRGNADSSDEIYYTFKVAGGGKQVIDLSKDSKVIKITALKSDNKTPLTTGKIKFSGIRDGNEISLGNTGSLNVIMNNTGKLKTEIISREEGYLYSEILDLDTVNEKVFSCNESVAKVDFTNVFDSKLSLEKLMLTTSDNSFYDTDINIKDKPLYITKGEYQFNYSTEDTSKQNISMYEGIKEDFNTSKVIKFNKPTLSIEQEKYQEDVYNLKFKDDNKIGVIGKNVLTNYEVLDPSGNKLVVNKDYSIEEISYKHPDLSEKYKGPFKIKLINKQTGTYKIKALATYYGESIQSYYFNINHIGANIGGDVSLKIDLPAELMKKISDKKDNMNIQYEIYDKNTKQVLNRGNDWKSYSEIDSYRIKVPTEFVKTTNNIYIKLSSNNGGVILDRELGGSSNNEIIIDANNSDTKRITVKNNSGLNIDNSLVKIDRVDRKTDGVEVKHNVKSISDLNLWVDKNNTYELSISNENEFLINEGIITDTNSTIAISNDFGKLKFTTPNDTYIKSVELGLKKSDKDKVHRMQKVNVKNEIAISSGFNISNIDYDVRSISNWIIDKGVNSTYNFTSNFTMSEGVSKNFDLTNLKVEYLNTPNSINYGASIDFTSSVSNDDLNLVGYNNNVQTSQNNKGESYSHSDNKLCFYNSKGKLDSKIKINNNNTQAINIDSVEVKPGTYTSKLELAGLKVTDRGFNLSVLENDTVKLRIMDPFDITKPLSEATIKVGYGMGPGSEGIYKTDRAGYVIVKKNDFSESEPIKIITSKDGVPVIFKTSKNVYKLNETIAVPIESLKTVNVKSKDVNGKLSIANKAVQFQVGEQRGSFILDNKGTGKIYTNTTIDNLVIKDEFFTLSTNYSGSGEVVFDNVNLGSVDIILGKDNYSEVRFTNKTGSSVEVSKNGIYYLSPGDYSYSYDSTYNYKGTIAIVNGVVKKLQFGNNISTRISTLKPNIYIGETLDIKLDSKDEFGNNINSNMDANVVASKNGMEIERKHAFVSSNNGENFINCKLDLVNDSFNVKLEFDVNGKKITTNEIVFTMNLLEVKKINIKAPSGEDIVSGKIIQTKGSEQNEIPISSGSAYIKTDCLSGSYNYTVFGKTKDDKYVLYGDLNITSLTTEIKDTSAKKVSMNVIEPNSIYKSSKFEITKKKSEKEDRNILISKEHFNGRLESLSGKYNNKELYISGSEFFVEANYYGDSSYELAQIVTKSDDVVTLNANNVTKVTVEKIEKQAVNNIELGSAWGTINISDSTYVSQGIFDKYQFRAGSTSGDGYYQSTRYSKDIKSKISGDTYVIKYSNPSKLISQTDDKLVVNKDSKVTAKLYVYDNYDNKVSMSSSSNTYMYISLDGKKPEKRSIKANSRDGYYEVDNNLNVFGSKIGISYSVSIAGATSLSNTISYTMNLSNYKAIPVRDPLGQSLVDGKMGKYSITNGNVYIDNKDLINLKSYYNIVGSNAKGDRVVYEKYPINKDTKEIIDKTLDVYTVNLKKESFLGMQNIKYKLKRNSINSHDIDSFDESGDEIRSTFKYFIKGGNYNLLEEVSNKDNIYLMTLEISKDTKTINITNNANSKISVKSPKYPVDGFYYSTINNDYGENNYIDNSKNIFVMPNKFYFSMARVTKKYENGYSSHQIYIKDSFVGDGDKTFLIGKEDIYDFKLKDCLYLDKRYNSIFEKNELIDEYGNKSNGNLNYSVKFIGNGYESSEVNNSLPSDIKAGIYKVEITINQYSSKPIKIIKENIKVIDESRVAYTISYNASGDTSYKLYKDGVEIDSKVSKKDISKIINDGKITDGDNYRLNYFIGEKQSYGNENPYYNINHYDEKYSSKLGKLNKNSTNKESALYKVSNAKVASIYGPHGLKSENIDINGDDLRLDLIKGVSYTVEALVEDGTGISLVKKTFVANSGSDKPVEIDFDKTALRKVSIDNGYKGKTDIDNLAIKFENGTIYELNSKIASNKTINLPKGKYEFLLDTINYDLGKVTYKKSVNVDGKDTSIQIGKNINYGLKLTNNSVSPNKDLEVVIDNIKDTDVIKSTLIDIKLENVKIDLMHGDKVIASFDKLLPNTLKGDCVVKVTGTNKALGTISSGNINVTVNNPNGIKVGDINLDNYVDIYDLVHIAKDIDKQKGKDLSYDPRVNLDDSNDTIDIFDLSKAAINYNN